MCWGFKDVMSMAFDKEYICISNHAPIKRHCMLNLKKISKRVVDWIYQHTKTKKKTKTKQEQYKIMLTPSQKAPKTPLPLKKQKNKIIKKNVKIGPSYLLTFFVTFNKTPWNVLNEKQNYERCAQFHVS